MVCNVNIPIEDALYGAVAVPVGLVPIGRVFWVDNSDSRAKDAPLQYCGDFDLPFASIAFAISRCASGRGDTILVKPGHVENETGPITVDKSSICIIGIGRARSGNHQAGPPSGNRPVMYLSRFTVQATNVLIFNFDFTAGTATAGADFSVEGVSGLSDGLIVAKCRIECASGNTSTFDHQILIEGSDCVVAHNEIILAGQQSEEATSAIKCTGAADRLRVFGNALTTFSATPVIDLTAASDEIEIARNVIYNLGDDDATDWIDVAAGSTGIIAHNVGFYNLETSGIDAFIDPASCACCQNFLVNLAGESGGLVPTTVSA